MSSPVISASIDVTTGEVYVPPRRFAADGSLRPCEPFEISSRGILRGFTSYGATFFGLVDLERGVRIQARLDAGPHEVGATYEGRVAAGGPSGPSTPEEMVFTHV